MPSITNKFSSLRRWQAISLLLLGVLMLSLLLTVFFPRKPQILRREAAGCNHTGVTKNPDGTYSFARLQINTNGILVDSIGCQVYLLGSEGKAPSAAIYKPYSGGYLQTTLDFSYLTQLNQTVPINMLRMPIRVPEWVDNPVIPSANNMRFQDFVKTNVKAIEAQGLYVQLDVFQFPDDYPATPTLQQQVQALTEMATIFGNDPAVIFDVRNEGIRPMETDPYGDDIAWLNAVEAANPNAVKVMYANFVADMRAGKRPVYTQHNLIIDMHLYPNQNWQTLLTTTMQQDMTFVHSKGQGYIINEWGGLAMNYPSYVTAITNFTIQNKIAGLNYFYGPGNWFTNGQPNANARLAAQAYSTIFGSALPYATPTPTKIDCS